MKYNVSKDFGIFRHFHSTLNPIILALGKICLSICPKGMHSSKELNITKLKVKSRDNKNIKTYIIKPKSDNKKLPIIFYFHGGAFTYKAAPYHYTYAKHYAKNAEAIVVLADYRLSHCSPFNTPLNDCQDVYKYFIENAETFGIDVNKIVVAGDSAGGYLSLMTTLMAYRKKLPMPKCQMLIYPVVDSRGQTQSMQKFSDTPFWNSKLNAKMWQIYQRGGVAENILECKDLSFLPISYIETAEFDCLKDEAKELFLILNKYNEKNILNETKQTMHGYDIFRKSEITKKSIAARIEFLKRNLL